MPLLAAGSHGPPLPHSSLGPAESSWERGLRSAKEMVAKASRRKELEVDFEDKKFNLGVDDEASHHSRHSHHSRSPSPRRNRSPSPYHQRERLDQRERPNQYRERRNDDVQHHREGREGNWDSEYERRRRLAFESAPWNEQDDAPPPPKHSRNNPEQFKDPWRRSKSPPNRSRPVDNNEFKRLPQPGKGTPSSFSSDSASDLSGSSDFSDSDSSGSFSDHSGPKNKSVRPVGKANTRPPPKLDLKLSGNQPDVSRLPRIPKINRSNVPQNKSKGFEGYNSGSNPAHSKHSSRPVAAPRRKERDSWSDSLSSGNVSASESDGNGGRRQRVKSREGPSKRKADDTSKAKQTEPKRHKSANEVKNDDLYSSPLSMSPGSPISGKSLSSPPLSETSQKKAKEPSFQMKFSKKVHYHCSTEHH